jgi:GNAT superfamily N-acetyltransferase
MKNPSSPIIEVLSSAHDRSSFDCGVEVLNVFLKQFALQNQKKNIVRTYVCVKQQKIVGYYSLAFGEAKQESAPVILLRRAGKYPISTLVLARLAVDKSCQGQGIGSAILKDAMLRTKQACEIAGLRAIVVHAKDDKARAFYARYGFIESLDNPLILFFPTEFLSS